MNFIVRWGIVLSLVAVAVFVFLHVLPYLLGALIFYGVFKLHQAFKDRRPPPPFRWP